MRRHFRHVLVWAIAFALVVGTTAWRPCAAMHQAAAVAIDMGHIAHVPSHHAALSGQHGGHAMHHQHRIDDSSAPPAPAADDRGCMKCCAMCTVANAVPPAMAGAMTFTASPAVFFRHYQDWTANTVAVDPGIPKRIV